MDLFVFEKCVLSHYHIMSFLSLSLHNELIAQYVAFELAAEKYLMDTYNFNTIPNNSGHRSSGKKLKLQRQTQKAKPIIEAVQICLVF